MANETPAELAAAFKSGIDRMNSKISQVDGFMNAATPKYKSYRPHGIAIEKVRMNSDGSMDYYDPFSASWKDLAANTDQKTKWVNISGTNGRDDGTFEVCSASAMRHKTNTAEHCIMVDYVYAGQWGMPDPAAPTDTTKVVPISQDYLESIYQTSGLSVDEGNNSFLMTNTRQRTYKHPAKNWGVGQGIWMRLRVKNIATGAKTLAEVVGVGECLKIDRIGHYIGL